MKIEPTSLAGVMLLTPRVFGDERGAFWETWNHRVWQQAGLADEWVQDNSSRSHRNVIRGLHYQLIQPQAKLVRVAHGRILDVAVDLRRGSPGFGRHVAVELSAENARMIYIPAGFAHGFAVLGEEATLVYKVNDYYCPEGERTLLWNDAALAIDWQVEAAEAIVSAKDRAGKPLATAEVFEGWGA